MIGTFFIKFTLSLENPSDVVKIYSELMVLDLVLFFFYMEILEFLLRKDKAKWFLKKSTK
jgi:hypothetical protein